MTANLAGKRGRYIFLRVRDQDRTKRRVNIRLKSIIWTSTTLLISAANLIMFKYTNNLQ